jgi:hypothetical protein
MHTLELGGRTFAVTEMTPDDFPALHPPLAALCGTDTPTFGQVRAALLPLPGALVGITHALRKADPTVTPEWVAEQVPDMGTAHDVYAGLMRAELDPPFGA